MAETLNCFEIRRLRICRVRCLYDNLPHEHVAGLSILRTNTAVATQCQQTALTAETDYRDVRVNYNAPPNSKSEFLDVRGDVPNLNAYDRLVNRVESMDTWYVMWSVTVGGNEMPEPTR